MNADLIYCDICFKNIINTKDQLAYYLTSCGNVCCQNCLQKQTSICTRCPPPNGCQQIKISEKLDFKFQLLFRDLSKVLMQIDQASLFQSGRFKKYNEHSLQKNFELEKKIKSAEKYLQKINADNQRLEQELNRLQSQRPSNTSLTKWNIKDRSINKEIAFIDKLSLEASDDDFDNNGFNALFNNE